MSAAVVHVRDEEIYRLIPAGTPLQKVAGGFDFLEGPIWDHAAQELIFSDILGNSLYSWTAAGGVNQLRRHSYMANGNAFDRQGRIISCEHATSRLSRFTRDSGAYEVLASHYDGRELNSPNDVVVNRDGAIYFTDPTSGRSADYGVPREPELDFSGVYRLEPVTGALTLLVDDFAKPNGLCFDRAEARLFVNDTVRQHIRVFDVTAAGTLVNGRLWADLEGDWPGVADGMKIDIEGNVYCCGPGGVQVIRADGKPLGVILMPEHSANLVFAGPERRGLIITASTSLYQIETALPGHVP